MSDLDGQEREARRVGLLAMESRVNELEAALAAREDTERPCPHCGKLILVPGRNYEIDPAVVCGWDEMVRDTERPFGRTVQYRFLGDLFQSEASRLVEHVKPRMVGWPYEVQQAVFELESAIGAWTELRRKDAMRDTERRDPALAIVEGLLRVVRGKVSESDAATDIEVAEQFLAGEDTERPDGPTDDDLTELIEMPRDLARVLRDPGIVVKQDGAIFDLIAKWQNAPTPTMSGPVQDPEQEREAKQ